MAGARRALLIASDTYSDPTFHRLRAPHADIQGMEEVLSDPAIGGYSVCALPNREQSQVTRAIERFFKDAGLEDLTLLYISGHGVKDTSGRLYLAMTDTEHDLLSATAVSAQFIRDQINDSRCRRVVVILDCCYAGAFPFGMRQRGEHVDVLAQLDWRGCAVMTSSSALEYAYEPDGNVTTLRADFPASVFTGVIINGLRSGEADLDGDGQVDFEELYEYAYTGVRASAPGQTPQLKFEVSGRRLFIAASPRGQHHAVPQRTLVQGTDSPLRPDRLIAASDPASLTVTSDSQVKPAARERMAAGEIASASQARAELGEPNKPTLQHTKIPEKSPDAASGRSDHRAIAPSARATAIPSLQETGNSKMPRSGPWWSNPVVLATSLIIWFLYAVVRVFTGHWYFVAQYHYLTPFYSPCVSGECVPGSSTFGQWIPAIPPIIPYAFVSLPFVLGFRLSCYYCCGAYYKEFRRAFKCEAAQNPHASNSGETKLLRILHKLHRFFFCMAVLILVLNTWDMVQAFRGPDGDFGVGLGSIIMLTNVVLLWAYTLSGYSCHYVAGGRFMKFSRLNAKHQQLAWATLGTLTVTDLYIMLVASGAFSDFRIFN